MYIHGFSSCMCIFSPYSWSVCVYGYVGREKERRKNWVTFSFSQNNYFCLFLFLFYYVWVDVCLLENVILSISRYQWLITRKLIIDRLCPCGFIASFALGCRFIPRKQEILWTVRIHWVHPFWTQYSTASVRQLFRNNGDGFGKEVWGLLCLTWET